MAACSAGPAKNMGWPAPARVTTRPRTALQYLDISRTARTAVQCGMRVGGFTRTRAHLYVDIGNVEFVCLLA